MQGGGPQSREPGLVDVGEVEGVDGDGTVGQCLEPADDGRLGVAEIVDDDDVAVERRLLSDDAFLGALVGSFTRPLGGYLADRFDFRLVGAVIPGRVSSVTRFPSASAR